MNIKLKIRTNLVVSLCILTFSFTSCQEFLEVETVGRTTIPNFFSTVDGLEAGLTGAYSEMYNYYSSEFYKYPEVAGNMVDLNTVSGETNIDMINQFNFISDPEQEAGVVGYIWRKIFKALANVNNIIEYCPILSEQFPNQIKQIERVKAEALCLRAICHFDLCRVYAQPYNYTTDASHLGVPVLLVTPGPDDLPSRASVKDVYDQVIKDLLEAEELFADTPMKDAYHVSKKAVQALLSRVYLYKEDWDNAILYSTKVINDSELAYNDDYLAMYNNLIAGKEAILRLNGTLKSKSLGTTFYAVSSPLAMPADTLMSLFQDPEDIRLKLFKRTGAISFVTTKYHITIDFTPEEERYDPFILRASEMYLNRAEAYSNRNELDKASKDLAQLIARALDKQPNEIDILFDSKEKLDEQIKKERVKELCFEGHNFFDIIRRKEDLVRGQSTASNVKFLPYPNDLFILPIPQMELDANTNMIGNPTVNN
ncbi:RagB/SusD family nutrient uptake outer membrane protein [Limibacterium fermenti]|uniref:RagB/SusD family nutrient uptake outer membrane protein n=1 Tax=Limibacterium fermenti TaxID=3229863 RepID=UPI000E9CB5D4|nr:RagB/SusD family nutrient uptake outer membrane protein [Porphyromonadaceae bacterium]